MALSWDDLQRMKRVEALANALGFELSCSDNRWSPVSGSQAIHVKPKDDLLPVYSRDATFFMGTIESIESWLDGIEWARHYDELLKVSHDKKRSRQEDLVRNQHLMKTIKTGRLVTGKIGSYGDEEVDSDEDFIAYADDGGSGAGY